MFAERRPDTGTKCGGGWHGRPRMTTGERKGKNFRFLFAYTDRILRPGRRLVNPSQSRYWSGSGHIAEFVIIGKLPPEWRYRLGVRTEDSQSSNPGSIPGSATKPKYFCNQSLNAL